MFSIERYLPDSASAKRRGGKAADITCSHRKKKVKKNVEQSIVAAGAMEKEDGANSTVCTDVPSVTDDGAKWGLDSRLIAELQRQGVERFFPIQRRVIPEVLALDEFSRPAEVRDVYVGSSTGSGKTLVYVLTILQSLLPRRVRRLRALVVLPSRGLAMQVARVFHVYAVAVGLSVGLATGQRDFDVEQQCLVGTTTRCPLAPAKRPPEPWEIDNLPTERMAGEFEGEYGGVGDTSLVDILVCTPGRLVEHLDRTPGFTLQHLHILVVDEADRLLNQSYQKWASRVLQAVHGSADVGSNQITLPDIQAYAAGGSLSDEADDTSRSLPTSCALRIGETSRGEGPSRSATAGSHDKKCTFGSIFGEFKGRRDECVQGDLTNPHAFVEEGINEGADVPEVLKPWETVPMRLQRMLFSATVSSDPQQLAALKMKKPKFYSVAPFEGVGGKKRSNAAPYNSTSCSLGRDDNEGRLVDEGAAEVINLPPHLSEYYARIGRDATKPLFLIALLKLILFEPEVDVVKGCIHNDTGRINEMKPGNLVLVFASSVDSAHRLSRLLQLLPDFGVSAPPTHSCGIIVAEFSSLLTASSRAALSLACSRGALHVVVCSDGMARGMDLRGVSAVVSYLRQSALRHCPLMFIVSLPCTTPDVALQLFQLTQSPNAFLLKY